MRVLHATIELIAGPSSSALELWPLTQDRDDVHVQVVEQCLKVLKDVLVEWHREHLFTGINISHATRLALLPLFQEAVLNAQLFA